MLPALVSFTGAFLYLCASARELPQAEVGPLHSINRGVYYRLRPPNDRGSTWDMERELQKMGVTVAPAPQFHVRNTTRYLPFPKSELAARQYKLELSIATEAERESVIQYFGQVIGRDRAKDIVEAARNWSEDRISLVDLLPEIVALDVPKGKQPVQNCFNCTMRFFEPDINRVFLDGVSDELMTAGRWKKLNGKIQLNLGDIFLVYTTDLKEKKRILGHTMIWLGSGYVYHKAGPDSVQRVGFERLDGVMTNYKAFVAANPEQYTPMELEIYRFDRKYYDENSDLRKRSEKEIERLTGKPFRIKGSQSP